jgi:2-amino-4-hydroxy-6-hydroxymethyldihydropteridine diphosphokinase
MKNYNFVYLALGSNLGDRNFYLDQAEKQIEDLIGEIEIKSTRIETSAKGFESLNDFLNSAILIKTDLSPLILLEVCKKIELDIGRTSKSKSGLYNDRVIDIDILYFNTEILNSPDLIVPHQRISEREFVLNPLCQIAPFFIHPVLKRTNTELLKSLTYKTA